MAPERPDLRVRAREAREARTQAQARRVRRTVLRRDGMRSGNWKEIKNFF